MGTNTNAKIFKQANNLTGAAQQAFVNANGGIANVGIQVLPNQLQGSTVFGASKLWRSMQANTNGKLHPFAAMLWLAVNGGLPPQYWQPNHKNYTNIPNGSLTGANQKTTWQKKLGGWQPSQVIPTKPITVPLAQYTKFCGYFSANINSGVNQNVILCLLNGGKTRNSGTYGTPLAQLVTLS